MGVVTVKSGSITKRDATPRQLENACVQGGIPRAFSGQATITSGDSTGSKYILAQVPSNARVHDLKIYTSADMGTTTVADIGLYQTTDAGGAVLDADFFGSAVSLKDGALNGSDILHESGALSIAEGEKMIWEAHGLSADPGVMYDVVATLTGDCDGTGVLKIAGLYVV